MLLATLICFFFLVQTAGVSAENGVHSADWTSLVESERAFARTAGARGTREAFLAFLADDSILFRPHAVPGRKWIEEHPSGSGLLAWEPSFAEVAGSGDLGYTTGPWEIRPNGIADSPSAFGEFVTVWKKQPGGDWKVVIDLGISHSAPAAPLKGTLTSTPAAGAAAKVRRVADLPGERAELLAADRELAYAVSQKGSAQGYLRFLSEDARFFRAKAFPVVGKREVFAVLSEAAGRPAFRAAKAEVSQGADLGCTYGTSTFANAESSNYVRIWRKQGSRWKLVLDIESPIPPPQKTTP